MQICDPYRLLLLVIHLITAKRGRSCWKLLLKNPLQKSMQCSWKILPNIKQEHQSSILQYKKCSDILRDNKKNSECRDEESKKLRHCSYRQGSRRRKGRVESRYNITRRVHWHVHQTSCHATVCQMIDISSCFLYFL